MLREDRATTNDPLTWCDDDPIYRIGSYELRPGVGLFVGGTAVPLPPKEAQLLELLVRSSGGIVTHGQIEAALWPRQTVSYASLARCVHSLRRRLGGRRQKYIATIPKRGYRLTVPVIEISASETETTIAKSVRTNPTAHAHYVEGLREANHGSLEHQERAVKLFEQAHQADPGYAIPLGAIAECRVYQAARGYLPSTNALLLASKATRAALAIDPNLAPAICCRAWFRGLVERRNNAAVEEFKRGLEVDPTYAAGHSYRAWILRSNGWLGDAVLSARRGVELDPHSLITRHALSWTLFCANKANEALDIVRAVRREHPDDELGHAYTAIFAAWTGNMDEARDACRVLLKYWHDDPVILPGAGYALACDGRHAEALEIARFCERTEIPRPPRVHVAMIYAAMGSYGRAIELIRQARDDRSPWFAGARVDPRAAPLQVFREFRLLFEA